MTTIISFCFNILKHCHVVLYDHNSVLYFPGLNNSGEEELAHWNDMRESKGEQVCRWHVLLES